MSLVPALQIGELLWPDAHQVEKCVPAHPPLAIVEAPHPCVLPLSFSPLLSACCWRIIQRCGDYSQQQ